MTANEVRISDWSSDVCSSDLALQLAAVVQLHADVATANQLTLDEQLRKRRPVGVAREVGAHFRIFQHIDVMDFGAGLLEHLRGAAGKAAHRDRKSTRLNSSH